MEAWNPEEGLRRIEQYQCTAAVTATPFLQMLMAAYNPRQARREQPARVGLRGIADPEGRRRAFP